MALGLALGSLVCGASLPAKSVYRELVAPDTVQRDFKGAVKTLKEKTYKVTDTGVRTLQTERVLWFDREGYQTIELNIDVATSGRSTESRIYDGKTLDLVRQETGYGGKPVVCLIKTDPAKKQVTWSTADGSGRLTPAKELTFGAFRKVAAGRDFDAAGRVTQSYWVTRDASGLGTELVFQDAKGVMKYRSVMTWDERGIMTGSVDEFLDIKSTAVRKFEPVAVDQAGNWTELRKSAKFSDKDGEHAGPNEVVIRVLEYYVPAP